jgi:hypothetical protein
MRESRLKCASSERRGKIRRIGEEKGEKNKHG